MKVYDLKKLKGVFEMSIRDSEIFLIKVKKALMITAEDTFADDEIKLHIDTCCQLLITTGVADNVVWSDNPLVEGIILIYVKTYFGFKNDGSVKELPASFDLLVRQLVLTAEEDYVS